MPPEAGGDKDLEIARLRRQVAPLASLVEASRVLNSALPEETLVTTILGIATNVMDAQASAIIRSDPQTGELHCSLVLADRPGLVEEKSLESPTGIPARVIREGITISAENVPLETNLGNPFSDHLGLRAASILCVPLRSRDRIVGAMEVVNKQGGGAFDDHDAALFMAIADQVGVAMRNAELYNEIKKKALERQLLLDVERQVIASLDTQEVMHRILDLTRRIVEYDAAGILVYDLSRGRMKNIESRGYPEEGVKKLDLKFGEGIAGWAAKAGESVLVPDVSADPRYVDARPSTRSEMAIPLKSGETVIGVFNLESDRIGAFTREHLALVESFANQAAIAIQNARLHEEATKGRRLEDELRIARRIQQRFLPKSDPQVPGFEIAGRTVPSKEVGGDYYDYVAIDQNRLAFVIADVAGKGVPAGLILASFRASLLTEARESAMPSEILSNVNFLLCKSTEPQDFVTAFLGILDVEARRLVYTNAGHNYPYLLRADGRVERLVEGGTILGIIKGTSYSEGTAVLGSGELLVLFSDGIIDAMNRKGEDFGEERLEALILARRGASAREICDAIFQETAAFARGVAQFDDMAVVVAKAL